MDTLGCFQGLPIGSRLTPLGVPPKKIPNPSIKITLKRWIPMTTTPPFRPTPLPALYESLQAPLTVLSSASKKRLPVDICRFLKKKPIFRKPQKVASIFRDFPCEIHGIQGTEYWLSLYSEGRNPRSGRRCSYRYARGGGRDCGASWWRALQGAVRKRVWFDGDFIGTLLGFYRDLMGFHRDLMGFYRDLVENFYGYK